MWCPNCEKDFEGEEASCPVCGGPLQSEGEPETEFLMYLVDRQQLEEAEALLMQARIPHLWREKPEDEEDDEEGDGPALYVDRRYTHRAMRLLRPLDQRPVFSEAELEAAMDAYGDEEVEDGDDTPTSPEGYRTLWVFLAIFLLVVLISLIPPLTRLLHN